MPTKAAAFQAFMSSFGMPAYAASAVPTDARMPYVTYTLADGAWGDGEVSVQADVWCRTESEAEANARASRIAERLGAGGAVLECDGGAMWVKRGYPFSQAVPDDDASVKRRYINLSVEYITSF